MRLEDNESNTVNWHEIETSAKLDTLEVVKWCLAHDSPYAVHFVADDRWKYSIGEVFAKIKFESKEDAILFAITWLGVTGV